MVKRINRGGDAGGVSDVRDSLDDLDTLDGLDIPDDRDILGSGTEGDSIDFDCNGRIFFHTLARRSGSRSRHDTHNCDHALHNRSEKWPENQ